MPTRPAAPASTHRTCSENDAPAADRPSPHDLDRHRGFPFHPLLIAAFPILSLYAHNMDEVPLPEVWRPLGLALVGALTVWLLALLLTRHVRKAALIASTIMLVFFSYGHIFRLLPVEWRGATGTVCTAGLLLMLLAIGRSRGGLGNATVTINLASVALLAPSCLMLGPRLIARASEVEQVGLVFRRGTAGQNNGGSGVPARQPGAALPTTDAATRPDIYYIILDAYGRADSLKTFYGYDNRPFVRALQKRGFYVPRHSRANYAQTGYALPTSLNMNYFDAILQEHDRIDNLFEAQRRLIDENAVAAFLRRQGYRYIYIWTGTGVTQVKTADLELDKDAFKPASSFEGQVIGLTPLATLPQTPVFTSAFVADYERHRGYIRTAFHNLSVVAKLPSPKFVFAHISAPHPPFVFGPNGEAVNPRFPYDEADGSQLLGWFARKDYKIGYIGQLQYINRRVLESVDAILRQSRRPPILIVQGDHGSRMNLDWESQERTDLREPFSILNAYYVPPRVRRHLYGTITPVNSFRILFTQLFGAHYPPLPDRSLFCLPAHPLQFTDVTGLIPTFAEEPSHATTAPVMR